MLLEQETYYTEEAAFLGFLGFHKAHLRYNKIGKCNFDHFKFTFDNFYFRTLCTSPSLCIIGPALSLQITNNKTVLFINVGQYCIMFQNKAFTFSPTKLRVYSGSGKTRI
jgi:hypothetical protein